MNCIHERFNPVTGECKCMDQSSDSCPHETPEEDDITTCPYCDYEIINATNGMECPKCDHTVWT
jgi:DNA-directed RNA polymerase subunit RPC12/RpoP